MCDHRKPQFGCSDCIRAAAAPAAEPQTASPGPKASVRQKDKQCDICSRPLTASEMRVAPAWKVTRATAGGFVPSRVGAHGPLAAALSQLRTSDVWRLTVSQNQTADWGFCAACYSELERF